MLVAALSTKQNDLCNKTVSIFIQFGRWQVQSWANMSIHLIGHCKILLMSKTVFHCTGCAHESNHHRFSSLGVYTIASQQEDPGLILGSSCAEFARLCGFSLVSSHIAKMCKSGRVETLNCLQVWMWAWVDVCLSVFNLWWTGDLPSVLPSAQCMLG